MQDSIEILIDNGFPIEVVLNYATAPDVTVEIGNTSGQVIEISFADIGPQGPAGPAVSISAGASSITIGELVFSNSNGLAFGLSGNTITGSYTQGAVSSLVYSNSNNVSFGLNGSTLTASASFSQSSQAQSSLVFSNSNGVTFGTNGSTLTASVATNYQSQGNYLTTAMLSNAVTISNINISGGTTNQDLSNLVFSNSNGVSFGLNGSTITASVVTNGGGGTISAGTTSMSLGKVVFSNSNGISFGLDGSTVTGTVRTDYQSSGAYLTTAMQSNAATISNVNLSAGTTSNNLSQFVFSNSNGVSFGLNGSTVTGSIATNYQSQGAYLTTAMLSNAATISNINISGGTTSSNLSNLKFIDSQGVSWSLDTGSKIYATVKTDYQSSGNYLTTADLSANSSKYVQNWKLTGNTAGTTSSAQGTDLWLAGGNGVTISGSSNTLSFSVATNYQSQGNYLTTADLSANSSKYVQNWKITGNTAGTTSSAQGTDLWLAGGNGLTISGSSNSLSFSVATNYQSQGAYLTTAMQSNAATISNINISGGTTSSNLSNLKLIDSNGVSWSLDTGSKVYATVKTDYQSSNANYLTSQSNQAFSAQGGSSAFQTLLFTNSNGFSFSNTAGSIWGSYTVPTVTNSSWTVSDNATSVTVGRLAFTQANGITMSLSTSNNGNHTVFASYNSTQFLTTADLSANSSKYIQNWKLTGNTAGTTSSAQGTDLWLAGGNGLTISGSSNTLSFSVATNYQSQGAYLTTAMLSNAATISNVNISGGTTSSNLSAFKFIDSQGVSWSLDTGSKIYATVKTDYQTSGAYLTTADLSANSSKYAQSWELKGNNTAGTTGSLQGATWYLSGGNNLTISGNSNTIIFSAGNAAASPVNFSAGTTSGNLGSVVFSNSNGVSFGLNGSTITGSIATSLTAINLSAGTTSNNLSAWVYSNSNNATFGLNGSTITVSSPISISAGTTNGNFTNWVYSNSNGVSFGLNGSTITGSVANPFISSYENLPGIYAVSSQILGGASVSHGVAFNVPANLSASFMRFPVLMSMNSTTIATLASATASASGAIYSTWNAVVYSMGSGVNSRSLQSVASGSNGWTFSQQVSITNSTQGSYSLGFTANVEGGSTTLTTQYSISNTNYSFTTGQFAQFSSVRMLDINFANSLSAGAYWLIFGYSSSSTSAGAAGLAALTNCNAKYSHHHGVSQVNAAFGIMGSTNMTSGGNLGGGSFSTAGGGTTNSIPLSAISTWARHDRAYFQLLRSA